MRIAAHSADNTRAMRAELRRIRAAVYRQRRHGLREFRSPYLDAAVPGAGDEGLLRNEVPVHGEDFAGVLLPGLDREVVEGDVEELYGAVAAGSEDLRFVSFGPGGVEECVLGVEPGERQRDSRGIDMRLRTISLRLHPEALGLIYTVSHFQQVQNLLTPLLLSASRRRESI